MSIDPLAAGAANLAPLVDAELASLAADAQALRALLVQNAVVTARVLASNGLTDLLEIAGRRVAASLPPTVRPGDVLQVRVTGFAADRILLQIVATGANAAVEPDPSAPQPVAEPPAVVEPDATVPPSAATAPSDNAAPTDPAPSARTTTQTVATVPQSPVPAPQSAAAPAPPAPPAQAVRADIGPAVVRANVSASDGRPAERATPAARAPIEVPPEPSAIEVRMAAARAAVVRTAETLSPERGSVPNAAPTRFVIAPQIAPRARPQAAAAVPLTAAAQSAPRPRASALSAYAEPVALLRALKLPVTPSNVAAAALALERPEQLPSALATLERALPRASDHPHVATLRALLPFVGRIDPRSPALATQIGAYVDHVVDGAEPKLATLLAATQSAREASTPTIPAAIVAERTAALGADLKQTMLAVAANPATPESVVPALSSALSALTAVQLNAAQTLAAHPLGLDFTIPLTTQHGPANARISVNRDGSPDRRTVDGENFRIAFILDTTHYGTIAIDLVTVGRDVSVDLRAESSRAMRAFRDALGGLTARLEALRYRVTSADAAVGVTSTIAVQAPPLSAVDPNAGVDRSA